MVLNPVNLGDVGIMKLPWYPYNALCRSGLRKECHDVSNATTIAPSLPSPET